MYLLETKNLQGIVEVRGGVPRLRRRHDPEANETFTRMRSTALRTAVAVKQDIESRSGDRTWVQAVIVFWSEFPEQLAEYDQCIFVHGSRLCDWLRARPVRLGEREVARLAAAVDDIALQGSGDVKELA